jgi:hypothetical protein
MAKSKIMLYALEMGAPRLNDKCEFYAYVSLGGLLGTVDRDSQISVNFTQT